MKGIHFRLYIVSYSTKAVIYRFTRTRVDVVMDLNYICHKPARHLRIVGPSIQLYETRCPRVFIGRGHFTSGQRPVAIAVLGFRNTS